MYLWSIELKSISGTNQADLRVIAKTVDAALQLAYAKTYIGRGGVEGSKSYHWNEYHVCQVKRLCQIDNVQE